MKLIVGLGNPGAEYARTRHNAGFMVVDALAARHAAGAVWRGQFQGMAITCDLSAGVRCVLLKPTTYMNRSGQAVAEAVRFYKLDPGEDMIVIVDELALDVGVIRARASGGAGGHNGLASIEQLLGTAGYARLRVGIGPKGPGNQVDYVLGRFSDEQSEALKPAIDRSCDLLRCWADEGLTAAMNKFNTPKPPKPPRRPKAGPDEGAESVDEQRAGESPGTDQDSQPNQKNDQAAA